jgi:outer membrane protein OmpA-like peptidoglycan-associated protein
MNSGAHRYEKWCPSLVGLSVCVIVLAACSTAKLPQVTPKQSVFVVIPDPKGEVGQITVTNRAGTQVLDHPRQASTVLSNDDAPSLPMTLEETEVSRIFGDALAAQPPAPAHFILYFQHDSEELMLESEALIPEVFRTIRDRGATVITIVGHTDTIGKRDYNYQLSLERAKKVSNLLISQGIDQSVLEVESHGEDDPLVKTGDEVREPRNRRVEITVW